MIGGKQSMESVLQNINKLNRSLEGVIAVGNFSISILCSGTKSGLDGWDRTDIMKHD